MAISTRNTADGSIPALATNAPTSNEYSASIPIPSSVPIAPGTGGMAGSGSSAGISLPSSVPLAPESGGMLGNGGPYGYANVSAVIAAAQNAMPSTTASDTNVTESAITYSTGSADRTGVQAALAIAIGFAVMVLA